MESLVSQLSDLLLSSGFNNPWDPQNDDDRTMQALHDAILDALLNGGALSEDMLNQLVGDATDPSASEASNVSEQRDQLEALVQQIIERLTEQGYVSMAGRPRRSRFDGAGRERGGPGALRSHRQGARFSRLPRLARSARRDGAKQRRPSRYARTGDRRGGRRSAPALRVRRHAESRCVRDGPQRHSAPRDARHRPRGSRSGQDSTWTTRI